jgi:HKD family nuclease
MAVASVELVARGTPMSDRLNADLESTSRLSIAVAYAKQSALSAVNLTEWVGPGRDLRLLAGTDFALTELDLLKRLEARQAGSCRVFHSQKGSNFHPKLYVLDKPDSRVIYVGSSNLTRGGLKGNVEANVRIEAEHGAPESVEALSVFEGLYLGGEKRSAVGPRRSRANGSAQRSRCCSHGIERTPRTRGGC